MTFCKLIEKMSENETKRCNSGKEMNGVYGVLEYEYEKVCSNKRNDSYECISLRGILYGLYGSHFISKKEFEELDAELDALLCKNS